MKALRLDMGCAVDPGRSEELTVVRMELSGC